MGLVTDEMSAYFKAADWQERKGLQRNDILEQVAQARAKDMKYYFEHQDLQGQWPNSHVRMAGYELPHWYADNSNQVESIALGYASAREALDKLANSHLHSMHMRGQHMWAEHKAFGMGYYCHTFPDRPDRRIFVVLTAPLEPTEKHFVWLPFITQGIENAETS